MSIADEPPFQVVVNAADQYSVWPGDRTPPDGWIALPVHGSRDECLDWIELHWTDMGPLGGVRRVSQGEPSS